MIWNNAKPWLYGAVALIILSAFAGQAVRISMLKGTLADERLDRVKEKEAAANAALADAMRLDAVASDLIKTQGERDAALKQTGRKVIEYVDRPGAAAQCFDADGLRIIGELARGAPADPSEPAGAVPAGTPVAD